MIVKMEDEVVEVVIEGMKVSCRDPNFTLYIHLDFADLEDFLNLYVSVCGRCL